MSDEITPEPALTPVSPQGEGVNPDSTLPKADTPAPDGSEGAQPPTGGELPPPVNPYPAPGKGGVIPPVSGQFRPGHPGGPGRRNHGMVLEDWINEFTRIELTEPQARTIATNKNESIVRRAAAHRYLQQVAVPDMSEFEPYLRGEKTLKELRADGIDTTLVKKAKAKGRTREIANTNGDTTTETEFDGEVELHSPSADEFDRLSDRTNGRPRQAVEIQAQVDTNAHHTVATHILENPDALAAALDLERILHQPRRPSVDADAQRAAESAIQPGPARDVHEQPDRADDCRDGQTPSDH